MSPSELENKDKNNEERTPCDTYSVNSSSQFGECDSELDQTMQSNPTIILYQIYFHYS